MLYCDLAINNVPIWSGVPCLFVVNLKSFPYIPFTGDLAFIDTAGYDDPTYEGLGGRYQLIFFPTDGTPNVVVPLQNIPNQSVTVVLQGQNCTIHIYDQTVLVPIVVGIPSYTISVDPPLSTITLDNLTEVVLNVNIDRINGFSEQINIYFQAATAVPAGVPAGVGTDLDGTIDGYAFSSWVTPADPTVFNVPDSFQITLRANPTGWTWDGQDANWVNAVLVGEGEDTGATATSNQFSVIIPNFSINVAPASSFIITDGVTPATLSVTVTRLNGLSPTIPIAIDAPGMVNDGTDFYGTIDGVSFADLIEPPQWTLLNPSSDAFEIVLHATALGWANHGAEWESATLMGTIRATGEENQSNIFSVIPISDAYFTLEVTPATGTATFIGGVMQDPPLVFDVIIHRYNGHVAPIDIKFPLAPGAVNLWDGAGMWIDDVAISPVPHTDVIIASAPDTFQFAMLGTTSGWAQIQSSWTEPSNHALVGTDGVLTIPSNVFNVVTVEG